MRKTLPVAAVLVGVVIQPMLTVPTASAADGSQVESVSLAPGSRHALFRHGRLAMPLPRMASDVRIGSAIRGRLPMTFRVAYAVSNPVSKPRVRGDRAVITTRVARSLLPTGANPDRTVYERTRTDRSLCRKSTTGKYRFLLPREATRHLKKAGVHSEQRAQRRAALRLITVEVQQYRDFQIVDGKYDWVEGTAFNAAEQPTQTADSPGSSVTVSNQTGAGVYEFATPGEISAGGFNGGILEPQYSSYQQVAPSTGVSVALAGTAVSCLYSSNDGSNPGGFDLTLPVGMAVTQKIVAQDTNASPATASDAAATSNAVEYSLKASLAIIGRATMQAFGGPFAIPVSLAAHFLVGSSECNNQPNIMQIGAVTADGQGSSSVSWAIWDGCSGTCGGLANVYASPWSTADASGNIISNAVQLSPDPAYTYQGQPLWLAQQPVSGCGVGDASDSDSSGCTSQNVINLYWTTQPPCPMATGININGGLQGGNQYCFEPAPTSPEIDYCGAGNADCASYSE